MKLKSMKLSKKKVLNTQPVAYEEEKWPWGLRITLNDEAIKKLGIDVTELEVRTLMPISGMARIKSVSSSDDGKGRRDSMDLQIEKLALGASAELPSGDDLDWDDRGDVVDSKLKKRGLLK